MSQLAAYYKTAGTNKEINSPHYELGRCTCIEGFHNCEIINLDFKLGFEHNNIICKPIDLNKPIILAIISKHTGCHFIVLDLHTQKDAEAGMTNYKSFKTDDFLICSFAGKISDRRNKDYSSFYYWGITADKQSFIAGNVDEEKLSDTWILPSVDLLCKFIAGKITVNQLEAESYFHKREVKKNESREQHVVELTSQIAELENRLKGARKEVLEILNTGQFFNWKKMLSVVKNEYLLAENGELDRD